MNNYAYYWNFEIDEYRNSVNNDCEIFSYKIGNGNEVIVGEVEFIFSKENGMTFNYSVDNCYLIHGPISDLEDCIVDMMNIDMLRGDFN